MQLSNVLNLIINEERVNSLNNYRMDDNTIEKARYIIAYYGSLLTPNEKKALRHLRSVFKLENSNDERLSKMYYKVGWLSDDPAILQLLTAGEDKFMLNCAERILKENSEMVYLNFCPECGRLARTPFAKQCRYCKHDWREVPEK